VERDSERRRAAYAEGLLSKTLRRLERVKEEREELRERLLALVHERDQWKNWSNKLDEMLFKRRLRS
jgi:hypothetical protein